MTSQRNKAWAAGTIALLGFVSAQSARANPITCTSTIVLGGLGNGFEADTSLGTGVCVQTADAVYGNFNISSLPAGGTVDFNLTNVGSPSVAYHGISFNDNFLGTGTYTAGYAVEILSGSNLFSELNSDFTQTNGTSTLMTTTFQHGSGSIDFTKVGAIGSGPDQINFMPGYTRLDVLNTLDENGSITSITNDAIENAPVGVPEPGSMALLISGVAGLGFLGWRHGRRPVGAAFCGFAASR